MNATPFSIHDACRDGDIDTVRQMIAADPSLVDADDKHDWRPVFHAALHRRVDVVRLLIESGADLAAHDWLAQYPDDRRFATITAVLAEHDTDA